MTEQEQAELIETLRSVFGRGKRCGTLADTFRCAVSGALDAKEEIHTLLAQNALLIEALESLARGGPHQCLVARLGEGTLECRTEALCAACRIAARQTKLIEALKPFAACAFDWMDHDRERCLPCTAARVLREETDAK